MASALLAPCESHEPGLWGHSGPALVMAQCESAHLTTAAYRALSSFRYKYQFKRVVQPPRSVSSSHRSLQSLVELLLFKALWNPYSSKPCGTLRRSRSTVENQCLVGHVTPSAGKLYNKCSKRCSVTLFPIVRWEQSNNMLLVREENYAVVCNYSVKFIVYTLFLLYELQLKMSLPEDWCRHSR
jgi:hypothetical protein